MICKFFRSVNNFLFYSNLGCGHQYLNASHNLDKTLRSNQLLLKIVNYEPTTILKQSILFQIYMEIN